jgi:hypothetical protein
MSMDGLRQIIGPSPCEMHDEERLQFASREIERIGIALQTHVEKEKAKKTRKQKKSNKEEARKLLKILEAAGITPQEYVEAMKGD